MLYFYCFFNLFFPGKGQTMVEITLSLLSAAGLIFGSEGQAKRLWGTGWGGARGSLVCRPGLGIKYQAVPSTYCIRYTRPETSEHSSLSTRVSA